VLCSTSRYQIDMPPTIDWPLGLQPPEKNLAGAHGCADLLNERTHSVVVQISFCDFEESIWDTAEVELMWFPSTYEIQSHDLLF